MVLTHCDIRKFFAHAENARPDGGRVVARLPHHVRKLLSNQDHVVLNRALYGQRSAPLLAEQCLWNFLRESGWKQTHDPAAWVRGDARIVIWVDDILLRSSRADAEKFVSELDARFPGVAHNDVSFFLGHHVQLLPDGSVQFSGEQYIREICKTFGITKTKLTPLSQGNPSRIPLAVDKDPGTTRLFQRIVGCLSHINTTSRPDIAFAASSLGQASHAPTKKHVKEATRTLAYLLGTADKHIAYSVLDKPNNVLTCYADASYADAIGFKSQTGYVVMLNGGPVAWASRTQRFVTMSSQEAEVVAAVDAVKEIIFLKNLLDSWHCEAWPCAQKAPITCYEDNQGAISWFENGCLTERAKHYSTRLAFIGQHCRESELIKWTYIETTKQLADMLTKSLGSNQQAQHADKILKSTFTRLVNSVLVPSEQSRVYQLFPTPCYSSRPQPLDGSTADNSILNFNLYNSMSLPHQRLHNL
eukprot:m.400443 g.400443  ORF g.400443 m.400443 type:complete len:473 (+) comp16784_c0_seq5:4306-5724(+)